MADRPSNQKLAEHFRWLLTEGAAKQLDEETMKVTKDWRGELWKAFREIEERLDPLKYIRS